MPKIADIQSADDPRDVIHEAVQLLAEGHLVAFPTDTVYVVAAHALHPEGVRALTELRRQAFAEPAFLALRTAAEALDYIPAMSELGRKFTRRCWPGPVILEFEAVANEGLTLALPQVTRQAVADPTGGLAAKVVAHDVVNAVLRLMPAPLIVAGETTGSGDCYRSAAEIIEAVGPHLKLAIDDGPCRYGEPSSIVRVTGDDWSLIREGVVNQRILSRLAGDVYLFVCTGNTCRSPMAEGLFRRMLAERLACAEEDLVDRKFVVASAGLSALPGAPAAPEAVQILMDRGVDLHGHESQPVTQRLLNQADYIFTMTSAHREAILREFPEMAPRVRLLASNNTDISDPIGFGFEEYQKCAREIEQYLQAIIADINAS